MVLMRNRLWVSNRLTGFKHCGEINEHNWHPNKPRFDATGAKQSHPLASENVYNLGLMRSYQRFSMTPTLLFRIRIGGMAPLRSETRKSALTEALRHGTRYY